MSDYITDANDIRRLGYVPTGDLSVPAAAPTNASVDATTYDDTVTGSGKLTVLVLANGDAAVAFAADGDAFPRMIFVPGDSTVYFGDGTSDPYNGGKFRVGISGGSGIVGGADGASLQMEPDGSVFLATSPTFGGTINIGASSIVNRDQGLVTCGKGVQPGPGGDAASVVISSAQGAPTIGGEVNDVYFDCIAADVNHWIYRCTTAGGTGDAVWTVVGGLT